MSKNDEEFIKKIILELKPKSHRGYRQLFGIRENSNLNEQLFNEEEFTHKFLLHFNEKSLEKGQHIKFDQLIIAVKHIEKGKYQSSFKTEIEYFFKGFPLKKFSKEDQTNPSKISPEKLNNENEENYSCYCSECEKLLHEGDLFIKSGNWRRPILCLKCYQSFYTPKCVRCSQSISFNENEVREDGLGTISFVEYNGLHWHSNCCVCAICLKKLIGEKFYQDLIFNQLFCLDHIPLKF